MSGALLVQPAAINVKDMDVKEKTILYSLIIIGKKVSNSSVVKKDQNAVSVPSE